MEIHKYKLERIGRTLYGLMNKVLYFLPVLISNYRFRRSLFRPMYRERAAASRKLGRAPGPKTVVYMVQTETTFSGGLSDRLRAIVSIYAECKRQGLPFRIVFEPLHLQDYLKPNKYDWSIDRQDIIWDMRRCYPCTILTYHHHLGNHRQRWAQRLLLRSFIKKDAEQIHVYSNMATEEKRYGKLFKELFVPTQELQEQINYHLQHIGGKRNYISMTFRFRQLLGDFKEGGETLDEREKGLFVQRCIACVNRMHQKQPGKKILVTADSATFLESLKASVHGHGLEAYDSWLYLIPGKVVHMGFTHDADKQTYMKSFVDYYMLSHASTVYLVRDKLMYHSGFPYRAAILNGADYQEITLD